jgi:transcription-repair coupling factor (superfamily II helicase)
VTHIDYGIAKFAGLEKKDVNGHEQEAIRLVYKDDDLLYVSIHSLHKISKYSGKDGSPPLISKLGTQEWENKKSKAKKRVKDIAKELISLYAKRKTSPGHSYLPDSFLQAELESSFLFEDTADQARATEDVKRDMQQPHPMDRLICGDVGFGKTEVAIRAAFKAATEGKTGRCASADNHFGDAALSYFQRTTFSISGKNRLRLTIQIGKRDQGDS